MHIESSEYRVFERRNQPARKPKGGGGPGLPEERFFRRAGHGRKPGMEYPRKIGALAAECGHTREAMEIEGYAHTGLRNVLGGLPRAPLADSLCPGLMSGCAFGARMGLVRIRGSKGRIRWGFGPGCRWDGEAVRQRAETRGQRSDEGCDFVLEDVGGELLMSRDCPEFAAGADGGWRGVKAVGGYRSPRPGGLRGGLGHDEHPWGLRRSVSQVDREVVRMRRIVESGCGFVLEDIGGEMLMPRDCPEFGGRAGTRRGGVKAPEGWRSPRPGGLRGGLGHDEHPWGLRRRVSEVDRGVVRMRRMASSITVPQAWRRPAIPRRSGLRPALHWEIPEWPEWGLASCAQRADGEWVMILNKVLTDLYSRLYQASRQATGRSDPSLTVLGSGGNVPCPRGMRRAAPLRE